MCRKLSLQAPTITGVSSRVCCVRRPALGSGDGTGTRLSPSAAEFPGRRGDPWERQGWGGKCSGRGGQSPPPTHQGLEFGV